MNSASSDFGSLKHEVKQLLDSGQFTRVVRFIYEKWTLAGGIRESATDDAAPPDTDSRQLRNSYARLFELTGIKYLSHRMTGVVKNDKATATTIAIKMLGSWSWDSAAHGYRAITDDLASAENWLEQTLAKLFPKGTGKIAFTAESEGVGTVKAWVEQFVNCSAWLNLSQYESISAATPATALMSFAHFSDGPLHYLLTLTEATLVWVLDYGDPAVSFDSSDEADVEIEQFGQPTQTPASWARFENFMLLRAGFVAYLAMCRANVKSDGYDKYQAACKRCFFVVKNGPNWSLKDDTARQSDGEYVEIARRLQRGRTAVDLLPTTLPLGWPNARKSSIVSPFPNTVVAGVSLETTYPRFQFTSTRDWQEDYSGPSSGKIEWTWLSDEVAAATESLSKSVETVVQAVETKSPDQASTNSAAKTLLAAGYETLTLVEFLSYDTQYIGESKWA